MMQWKCWTPWIDKSRKSESCADINWFYDFFLHLWYVLASKCYLEQVLRDNWKFWKCVFIHRKVWGALCINPVPDICSHVLCSLWNCWWVHEHIFAGLSMIIILSFFLPILLLMWLSTCCSCHWYLILSVRKQQLHEEPLHTGPGTFPWCICSSVFPWIHEFCRAWTCEHKCWMGKW